VHCALGVSSQQSLGLLGETAQPTRHFGPTEEAREGNSPPPRRRWLAGEIRPAGRRWSAGKWPGSGPGRWWLRFGAKGGGRLTVAVARRHWLSRLVRMESNLELGRH
jgi:hypothetical protein